MPEKTIRKTLPQIVPEDDPEDNPEEYLEYDLEAALKLKDVLLNRPRLVGNFRRSSQVEKTECIKNIIFSIKSISRIFINLFNFNPSDRVHWK